MSKNKNLDKLLNELNKNFKVKRASEVINEEKLRTGIYALDYVLDGGISQCEGGHRIEFFGAESSGKSTFALYIIKKYQELGKTCIYIDAENSYDQTWAKIVGVNNEELIVINPEYQEDVGDLFIKIIPEADLIVIDSIVGLIPKEETERDTDEPTMALQARVNALITRKIYRAISGRKTTIIFINQLREKVGVMYGNPYTTGGGRALKHLYSTRIEFKAGKPIDIGSGDNKERIGMEINLKCVKNKKGIPYRDAIIDFYTNGTIDNKKSLFYSAIKNGIIQLSGKTYTFNDKKAVGKEVFMELLTDKDYKEIENKIWEVK